MRRSLASWLVGARIARVRVNRRDVVTLPSDPAGGYGRNPGKRVGTPARVRGADLLSGATVTELRRRGKQLCIVGRSGPGAWRGVLVHLGMTGGLSRVARGHQSPAHAHVVWTLESGERLVFADARRFGGLWTLEDEGALMWRHWSRLGPDALGVRAPELVRRLARTSRPIKAALLDQGVLAGVGNIYADEALFLARVHPGVRADELDGDTVRRLAGCVRRVLREGIEAGGSTLRDFRDSMGQPGRYAKRHRVYGRAGEACRRCGTTIEGTSVGQRTTAFCPVCQDAGGA